MCFCGSYPVYRSIVSPCTQSLKISDPQVPRVRAISRFFPGQCWAQSNHSIGGASWTGYFSYPYHMIYIDIP